MDEISLTVTWKDLLDRGLKENAEPEDLHTRIEKHLKEVCTEKYRNTFPTERFPAWHFVKIHFFSASNTYYITIKKGLGVQKG
jgi:hypothetical protein